MRNTIYIIFAGILIGLLAFTGMINIAEARPAEPVGTLVGGTFNSDVTWTKEGSPYILTDTITVNGPYIFTIGPGVTVDLLPERINMTTYIYVTDGTLRIEGTANDRVNIKGIDSIHLYNSTAFISNVDMTTHGPGLGVFWSKATIASSTFMRSSGAGLSVWSGTVDMRDSIVSDNAHTGIHITSNDVGRPRADVAITNSIIADNGILAVNNMSDSMIRAEDNWWGNANGPATSTGSGIKGLVSYSPWLSSKPDLGIDPKMPSCCSSVLFIPGLEASRLYRPDTMLFGNISTDDRLWEPNRNEDVRNLFLNNDGSSINPSVYAGDPIGRAFGFMDIYGSFMEFLDGLARDGVMMEWMSFGYDWRKPIAEVVAGRQARATTTESLLETVQDMATRSKTGKVTLVAHSNGGLVAKYLVKALAEAGKESMIDSVISVAVPYVGTPQAILGLLHGDDQQIAGGLILKKSVARELGTNMPSAYSLLPSAEYFKKAFGPTIAFAASTSSEIDTASAQGSFISGKANSYLMNAAEILHGILDPWTWPAKIARWAIVGWGNTTAKGMAYTDDGYAALTTTMGDGTVVAPSAAFNAGTTTALDLREISREEGKSFDHANILGSWTAKTAIRNMISNPSPLASSTSIESELDALPGVSIGEPDYSQEGSFVTVSTHSPVELHLYDSQGRHTGIAPLPDGMDEDIEEGLFTFVEKQIPGSSFDTYGDEETPKTYITLPSDDYGQGITAIIKGTGVGEFTYKVEDIQNGKVVQVQEYSGLPVTPLTVASSTFTVGNVIPSALFVDVDGDGSTDLSATSTSVLDPIYFFEALKRSVMTIGGEEKLVSDLVKKIDRIEDAYSKDRKKQAVSSLSRLTLSLGHKQYDSISIDDKGRILGMIGQFLAQF